ncbi:metallophosphoesterase [Dysgonomonas sp. 25]|nr:metallophosphoesterase [Dysgonomonas sp. 25]
MSQNCKLLNKNRKQRYKKRIIIAVVILLLLMGGCVGYAFYEAKNIKISTYTFRHQDIPEAFDGKKLVFISDIHCDQYFTREDVRSLAARIDGLNPDIVLLGGDYVSKSVFIDSLFSEISKQPHGKVYAVLGNHDHWTVPAKIRKGLEERNILLCDNRSYWFRAGNDSIKIGGVGDWWSDEQLIENTTQDVDESDFCILLSHQPDYIDQIETDKVDLMLSGHTHGGQVTFFGLWAPVMPGRTRKDLVTNKQEYRYGWVEKGNISLYVTTGVGAGGYPIRFFAQPEIVEIILKKEAR